LDALLRRYFHVLLGDNPAFVLNQAGALGNLIVNNLDFDSQFRLVRIVLQLRNQRRSSGFQLITFGLLHWVL